MAPPETTFTVTLEDTDPLVTYAPAVSLTDANAGWALSYTNGTQQSINNATFGVGDSFHITRRAGTTLSFSFFGNAVTLLGAAHGSQYQVSVDGASAKSFSEDNGVLARIEGLNSSAHSVVLQLNALDSQFEFDKAIFTAGTGMTGGNLVNQTFRETDSAWSFDSSAWIELGPLSPIPRNGQVVRGTTQTGKPATLQFQGSAVYLYGDRVSNHGVYQVTLDGVASKFNGSSPDFVQDALLFFGAGLDPTQQHTLALENLSQDQFVDFEYAVVLHLNNAQPLSAPPTGKSTNVGAIAGGVVGGVALLGFLGAIVFFALRRRRRHAEQRVDGVTSMSEVSTERYAAQPWTHSRAPSSTEVTPFVAPTPSYNPTHGQLPEPSSKLAAKGFEKPSPHAAPVSDTAPSPSRPMSPSNMTTTGSASIYSADDSQRPPLSHNDMERVLEFVASRIDRTGSAPPGSAASDLDAVPPPHYG